jgi:hypothetical protein
MLLERAHIVKLINEEIKNPSLGVSEQIIASHQIIYKNTLPVIARIDDIRELNAFYVYLPLQDEPYYWVVVIRKENNQLIISASYIESNIRMYLFIQSKDLTSAEITNKIKLNPTKTNYSRLKYNNWWFEPQSDYPEELERKLDYLLNCLMPYKNEISLLSSQAYVSINIAYKGYKNWMGGWHLTTEQIQKISALKCEIDLDIYAYGAKNLP